MATSDETPTTPKATASKARAPKATTRKATQHEVAVAKAGDPKESLTRVEPKARPKAKAAPSEVAPPAGEVAEGTKRTRGLARIGAIAGVAALGVATLYLLAMTVLWGVHHHALTSAHEDLREELTSQPALVSSQGADLDAGQAKLNDAVAELSEYAKQKANAEDFGLLYRSNGAGMLSCANERVEVVSEVKNRGIYITWTLHRYDDQVAAFCNEIVGYFDENTASEESL